MAIEVESSGLGMVTGMLERFGPEPQNGLGSGFGKILNSATEFLGGSTVTHEIAPEYKAMLELQMQVQTQMQEVNLTSNVEKTRHESKMAPIRNIRAG